MNQFWPTYGRTTVVAVVLGFMLLLDEDAALAAIPAMLQRGGGEAKRLLVALQKTIHAAGAPEGAKAERLAKVEKLFASALSAKPKGRRDGF